MKGKKRGNEVSTANKSSKAESNVLTERKRPVLFEYPQLPLLETIFCFSVLIWATAFAWWRTYETSIGYLDRRGEVRPTDWAFIGGNKDYYNWEWEHYKPFAYRLVPWLIGHSIFFTKAEPILGQYWSPFMLAYWVLAVCFIASWKLVLFCIVEAAIVYICSRLAPHWTVVWTTSIGLLCFNLHKRYDYFDDFGVDNEMIEISFFTYKIVQYISFCLSHMESPNTENKPFFRGFYNLLWYSFYLPYSVSIIRIYRKFSYEFETRKHRNNGFYNTLFFGVRIIFWFYFADFVRNFMYFDSMVVDIAKLRSVSQGTLLSIGYVTGIWFYLKYHVIFGLLATFARFDNMSPPDQPNCICRVAVYSNLWRSFDRGLYDFFKEHIFLPICRPSFSIPRKVFGLSLSYVFLLTWHGWTRQHIIWVILNIIPLIGEQVLKGLYAVYWRPWRESKISDVAFRRLMVIPQEFTFAFGTYATFYFISSNSAGWVYVDRMFWGVTVHLEAMFWILVAIGYPFCQACIQCEMWEHARNRRKQIEETEVRKNYLETGGKKDI